jgi:hypothetical protein
MFLPQEPSRHHQSAAACRYVDLQGIPRSAAGTLDFSSFDFHAGRLPLPVVKLIDDFKARKGRRPRGGALVQLPWQPRKSLHLDAADFCIASQRVRRVRVHSLMPPQPPLQASWDYVGSDGTAITLQTNLGAPRYRVVRGDISAAGAFASSCTDLLPQHDRDLLQWCCLVKGGTLVVSYLRDVAAALQLHAWGGGELLKKLDMPGIGSVSGFSGDHKSTGGWAPAASCAVSCAAGVSSCVWPGRGQRDSVVVLLWLLRRVVLLVHVLHGAGELLHLSEQGAMPASMPRPLSAVTRPALPQGATYLVDLAGGVQASEPRLFRRIATKGFTPDDFETKQVRSAAVQSCAVMRWIVHEA